MAILNNSNAISSGGYDINNSLRFRSSASAYLNRTPASASNRKTWTWSGWVKRGVLSSQMYLLGAGAAATEYTMIRFTSGNSLEYVRVVASVIDAQKISTAVYRDPAAWYHVVVVEDAINSVARVYVNGSEVTYSTNDNPSNVNGAVNNTVAHRIADGVSGVGTGEFDGYIAELNFIDGQALTPSSFGSTNATTGVWQPIKYTGTYGTNGFYLKFSDIATTSGSNAGLGKDFSGNANYFTTNNISVTAGTTYDAMIDSPTLTSATVANYPVISPLTGVTPTGGNLNLSGGDISGLGTMAFPSTGKWYFEMVCGSGVTTTSLDSVGIGTSDINGGLSVPSAKRSVYMYRSNGVKLSVINGGSPTQVSYGATFVNNDVIGVAFDCDADTLTFYKNNTSQGTAFSNILSTTTDTPFFLTIYARGFGGTSNVSLNAGQRPFAYTPPSGFVRLNTFNLPTSTIVKGNTVMDATLYTGTGASLSVTNAGAFKPDLVWVKGRSGATDHALYDSVRGTTKQLESNTTTAETTEATGLTAFGTGGFTVGALAQMNTSAATYVAWQWQAGQGTTSSNTSGTITSTVSVSTTAGFSVVTYTGTGSNATVGHGLGVAPKWIIVKTRNAVDNWAVYHSSTGATQYLQLNTTDASANSITLWNDTSPTSTVFSVGTNNDVNAGARTYVAYCWAEIAGFSKFGSYTGNGSADGPFVYLGFRPKYVMVKSSSNAAYWIIEDSTRNPSNVVNLELFPNDSLAETNASRSVDFLSNGFKLRHTDSTQNSSGWTYIYMAFAENPFKNALAR